MRESPGSTRLTPQSPSKRQRRPPPASVIIPPFLLLGSVHDSRDTSLLRAHNVRSAVDCGWHDLHSPTTPTEDGGLKVLRLPALDNNTQDMTQYFHAAIQFIEDARRGGGGVLVYCSAGISRSATIVIAYTMWYAGGLTFAQAYSLVQSTRPLVSPNLNFVGQLVAFEKELKSAGCTLPKSPASISDLPLPCPPPPIVSPSSGRKRHRSPSAHSPLSTDLGSPLDSPPDDSPRRRHQSPDTIQLSHCTIDKSLKHRMFLGGLSENPTRKVLKSCSPLLETRGGGGRCVSPKVLSPSADHTNIPRAPPSKQSLYQDCTASKLKSESPVFNRVPYDTISDGS